MILVSANNANTTLAAGLTSGATTVALLTGTGALFPSPGADEYFTLTLNDQLTGQNYEVCWCTARTGDSLTVMRGQEGTSARSWLIGDFAYNTETAGSISTGRAFSASYAPVLPFTIPAAHNGITQLCGSTGTITMPATAGIVDGFLCPITCAGASATITVNTNSATVILPTGTVTTTFSLAGLQSGVILQWNATAATWYSVGSMVPQTGLTVLTSGSGNFTVPCPNFDVEVWGAGGGGGYGGSSNSGSGGGGGGYSLKRYLNQTPGATIAYAIGAGGTGGTSGSVNGTSGGASTFGGITANGGGGGQGNASTGSAGGTAAGGDVNIPGAGGAASLNAITPEAGGPGGAAARSTNSAAYSYVGGAPGVSPGGGGGGGAAANNGGAGGAGEIVISPLP